MDFVHNVQRTIDEERLLEQNDIVVVAVSGGPDSTALLHVLHELSSTWRLRLIIAHMNHQFRGEESDQDAESVSRLAKSLGWPCEIGVVNVPEYMQIHSLGAQVASRETRYAFLMQVAEQYKAHKIAVAHHADDQAETVLMRLIRGSGPNGLSGIPIRREVQHVTIVRPFLYCYKADILLYIKEKNLNFRLDRSNKEKVYTRNQVRLDMMPYLQQWNDNLPQALNKLASIMDAENIFMEQETKKRFAELVKKMGEAYNFSKKGYLSLPIALQRRLIKLILNYLFVGEDANDFTKVDLVRHALFQQETPSMTLHLGGKHTFTMEYDHVQMGHISEKQPIDYAYTISAFPVEEHIFEAMVNIKLKVQHVSIGDLPAIQNGKTEVHFDLDQIALPLTIRNRRQGDRMKVFGLQGTKKVKDIFIDEKIPPSRRRWHPIVVDAKERLLWIPGIRFAEQAMLTESTVKVLHMSYDDHI